MTRLPGIDIVSSRAKSALQAVSAKAEWVLSEIKADLKAVTDSNGFSSRESPGDSISRGNADPPWVGKSEHEKMYEDELKERILDISNHPKEYFLKPHDETLLIDMRAAMASAGAVLEEDEGIRKLRFELVPKQMKEHEFWRRYFLSVKAIKQEVLAGRCSSNDGSLEASEKSVSENLEHATLSLLQIEPDALEEEAYQSAYGAVAIAPSMVVRRLAAAVDVARTVGTMEALALLEGGANEQLGPAAAAEKWTNSIKQSVGAGFAALGSLSGRERDRARERLKEKGKEKGNEKGKEIGMEKGAEKGRERGKEKEANGVQGVGLDEIHALLWSLFDADTQYVGADPDAPYTYTPRTVEGSFIEEIHGAPPGSFVPQLAEIIAGIKTEQKMSIFWQEVVKELRDRWQQRRPIPRLPVEANPDLHTCLLNQQLQLINCCMARGKRRALGLAELSLTVEDGLARHLDKEVQAGEGAGQDGSGEVVSGKGISEDVGSGGAVYWEVTSGELKPGEVASEDVETVSEKVPSEKVVPEEVGTVDAGEGSAEMTNQRREEETGSGAEIDQGAINVGKAGVDKEKNGTDVSSPQFTFGRLAKGTVPRRLGAAQQVPGIFLLETGEPLCAPHCQEGPVLTEDFVREAEELILRTGSSGAGCSQLFSDMQAFKAANPGCIIEDFVRWYSPLDWARDSDSEDESQANGIPPAQQGKGPNEVSGERVLQSQARKKARGFLSARMQAEGNLWLELWHQAKPVPAVMQAPLFDEELAAESTLDALDAIAPSDLFEQLFIAALGAGFAIALAAPQAQRPPLSLCLQECSASVVATCTRGMGAAKLDRLCQVYEVMETAVRTPVDSTDSPAKENSPVYVRAESVDANNNSVVGEQPLLVFLDPLLIKPKDQSDEVDKLQPIGLNAEAENASKVSEREVKQGKDNGSEPKSENLVLGVGEEAMPDVRGPRGGGWSKGSPAEAARKGARGEKQFSHGECGAEGEGDWTMV